MSRYGISNRNTIILTIVIVLVAMLSIGTAVKLNNTIETKTVSATAFSVGELGSDGLRNNESDSKSIAYTKDYYNVDGLEVEIDEEAEFTYKLFFYDEDKKFISSTADLSTAEFEVPDTANFVRIQVTLTGEDEFGVLGFTPYSSQLTVTVGK